MKKIYRYSGFLLPVVVLGLTASLLVSCQPAPASSQPEVSTPASDDNVTYTAENYPLPLTPVEEMGLTEMPQDVDIETYRLTVDGLVEKPLSLSYDDIRAYPSVTEIGVVDCPGFFTDIGEWTGVRLTVILAEAGVKPEASQVTFRALDGYSQTISLGHVEKYRVFLAYKVNGIVLPREHGYPLRVVDNGSSGSAWVKWLESIEVS